MTPHSTIEGTQLVSYLPRVVLFFGEAPRGVSQPILCDGINGVHGAVRLF